MAVRGHACDHGHASPSWRLDLGAGQGVFLCRGHWASEMQRRKERNMKLGPGNHFPVLPWPGDPEE